MDVLETKKQAVLDSLKSLPSLLVAFSGGVDSTLLLALAQHALGDRAVAATIVSPVLPQKELEETRTLARQLGVRHKLVNGNEMQDPDFLSNPPRRCYFCKKSHVQSLMAIAGNLRIDHLATGVNADDLNDFRPGIEAARELGALSPLAKAGLTKTEIRQLARDMGLPNWDKPSFACLASRIPYGERVTRRKLGLVEESEEVLRKLGLCQYRVRYHGAVARIEVQEKDMKTILENRREIRQKLRELGFSHVSLDLGGYQTGSLNQDLTENEKRNDQAKQ